MKKLTAIILAMLLACTAVVGCEKDTPATDTKTETTQSETSAQSEDITKDYDQDDSQQGFTIYGKKYYYKGDSFYDQYTEYSEGDVLILTVTNETETDYKAALKVTFLDENGETVKTQSKTFTQSIAGYTNYFVFQPGKDYSSYTCDLSLTEIGEEEDILVDKLTLTYEGTRERILPDNALVLFQGIMKEIPQLKGRTSITWSEQVPLYDVHYLFVLFDNTGDVYLICPFGARTNKLDRVSDYTIYSEHEHRSKVLLPDELKGELNYLVFPVSFDYVEDDNTN